MLQQYHWRVLVLNDIAANLFFEPSTSCWPERCLGKVSDEFSQTKKGTKNKQISPVLPHNPAHNPLLCFLFTCSTCPNRHISSKATLINRAAMTGWQEIIFVTHYLLQLLFLVIHSRKLNKIRKWVVDCLSDKTRHLKPYQIIFTIFNILGIKQSIY